MNSLAYKFIGRDIHWQEYQPSQSDLHEAYAFPEKRLWRKPIVANPCDGFTITGGASVQYVSEQA
jgi:hypothetical protein